MINKYSSFLLIWFLSVFCAEIFSGAGAHWVWNPILYFMVIPIYLFHTIVLLSIWYKYKRISLWSLYFLGIIFWLYETWITKVWWGWYINEPGAWMGTILWIALPEFPILVFFFHAVFSFILPILVFQILGGRAFHEHKTILKKSKFKTSIIYIFLFGFAWFISYNNPNNILENIWFLLFIFVIIFLSKYSVTNDIRSTILSKKWFIISWTYLFFLYILTFFFFFPERIPQNIFAYLLVIWTYIFAFKMFKKTNVSSLKLETLDKKYYWKSDLKKYMIFLFVCFNILNIVPQMSFIILILYYLSYLPISIILLIYSVTKVLKNTTK